MVLREMKTEEYLDLITASLDSSTLDRPDIVKLLNAFAEKNLPQVEIDCVLWIEEDSDDSLAWTFLGLCFLLRGDENEGTASLNKAVFLDKTNVLAMNLLGDYYCTNKDEKEGEAFFWWSLDVKEGQVFPNKRLYYQFMSRKEYEKALRVLESILHINQNDMSTWVKIESCFSKMEPIGFVEGFVSRLTHFFPEQPRAWYLKGSVLRGAGRLEEAESSVRRALEMKEDHALSWMLLGSILDDTGRLQECVDCYQKAVECEPRNMLAWMCLSLVHLRAGNEPDWEHAVDKAVAIDPKGARDLLEHLDDISKKKRG